MGKKKLKKAPPLEIVEGSNDYEVKNYDYEYLQGCKSDGFESDLNYVLNQSSSITEIEIVSHEIEIIDIAKKCPKRPNKKLSIKDVTQDLADISFSDSEDEMSKPDLAFKSKKGKKAHEKSKQSKSNKKPISEDSDTQKHANIAKIGKNGNNNAQTKKLFSKNDSLCSVNSEASKESLKPSKEPKKSESLEKLTKSLEISIELLEKSTELSSSTVSLENNLQSKKSKNRDSKKNSKHKRSKKIADNTLAQKESIPSLADNTAGQSDPIPVTESFSHNQLLNGDTAEDFNKYYDDLCEAEVKTKKKNKRKPRKKATKVSDVALVENPNQDTNESNKENLDNNQKTKAAKLYGKLTSNETKERYFLKQSENGSSNEHLISDRSISKLVGRETSVAKLRSIFENLDESSFEFNLKKTNSISELGDKLPEVSPTKTIIGLSHLQILKLDIKDVKIKTLVSSSSLSKYANTGLMFTIKHTDDLFENYEEKVIFFQLCIYIALFEAIGYKKISQKYDILQLFGDYPEINLGTTKTKWTPSSKEVHQNNLDYSVLSYLGHILIWAANLQIKSGVETIYSIYNINVTPDTVRNNVGGCHLWDRLIRELKFMSSKRWKHIIKFRTAFPFEIDQFTLILRFMKVDINNLINWD